MILQTVQQRLWTDVDICMSILRPEGLFDDKLSHRHTPLPIKEFWRNFLEFQISIILNSHLSIADLVPLSILLNCEARITA